MLVRDSVTYLDSDIEALLGLGHDIGAEGLVDGSLSTELGDLVVAGERKGDGDGLGVVGEKEEGRVVEVGDADVERLGLEVGVTVLWRGAADGCEHVFGKKHIKSKEKVVT